MRKFISSSIRFGRQFCSLAFLWLWTMVLWELIVAEYAAGYNPQSGERFYIPMVDLHDFKFDGQIGSAEWEGANWFSFGTEGNPEVIVFSRYKDDSLFFAFRINFESKHSYDKLIICIDPKNEGGNSNLAQPLRYDVFLNDTIQIFSTWDDKRQDWVQPSSAPYINTQRQLKTYQNTKKQYYEMEIAIKYSQICSDFGTDYFGLYFLILDWINNYDFIAYWWPQSAAAPDINLNPPSADQWANAILVTSDTPTQADIFFNCRHKHLRTTNSNDLTIKSGSLNSLQVRVDNQFIGNQQTNGEIKQIPLQLYFCDFGLHRFSFINSKPDTFDLQANSWTERTVRWHAPSVETNMLDTVSLRAELLLSNDPIRSNNSTRRTMQYLEIPENEAADVAFKLQAIDGTSFALLDSEAATSSSDFEYNPMGAGPTRFLYLFLDRTALSPSVPDSVWNIKLATIGSQESLDSLVFLSDRDSVLFGSEKSEISKKFLIHFNAPDYRYFRAKQANTGCFLWRWLKSIFMHKATNANSAPSISTLLLGEDSYLDDDHPIFSLTVKVMRKAQQSVLRNQQYRRMEVFGNVGVIFKVLPKPMGLMNYVKWVGLVVVSLATSVYYYLKRKARRLKPKAA